MEKYGVSDSMNECHTRWIFIEYIDMVTETKSERYTIHSIHIGEGLLYSAIGSRGCFGQWHAAPLESKYFNPWIKAIDYFKLITGSAINVNHCLLQSLHFFSQVTLGLLMGTQFT